AGAAPAAPEPSWALWALRGAPRAARAAGPLLRRARASRAGRRDRAARARFAAGARRRGGRGLPALLFSRPRSRAGGCGGAAPAPPERARRRLPRDLAGVSRVRASLDDRDRRLPRAGCRELPGRARRAGRGRRPTGTVGDALVGWRRVP